jgi:hypothetical protein
MHNVAEFRVIAQQVGNDFAECLGVKAFIDVPDGVVHILFLAGNTAQTVFILHECKYTQGVSRTF